ncbi:hypothetical protein ES703_39969 [subsurface metagenome]
MRTSQEIPRLLCYFPNIPWFLLDIQDTENDPLQSQKSETHLGNIYDTDACVLLILLVIEIVAFCIRTFQ